MKAFLWHEVDKVSNNYHEHGSVLIEAETLERAREIAMFKADSGEYEPMDVSKEPDAIFESSNIDEKVWSFPNAGCC